MRDQPKLAAMTAKELAGVETRLDGFLSGLLAGLGRSERRHWAKIYLRGLLLDGERKSIASMPAFARTSFASFAVRQPPALSGGGK